MNDDLLKILVLLGVVFFIVGLGMNVLKQNMNKREGLANQTDSGTNGEAGNAANFVATIKAQTVLLQDSLLISKYRTDYETIILNLDDYLNNTMLNTILTIDYTKPDIAIAKLNSFNQAKQALNSLMKYVDTSK